MMQQSSSVESGDDVELLGRKRVYTLPTFRYLCIAVLIVLVDGIVSVTLWLTGNIVKICIFSESFDKKYTYHHHIILHWSVFSNSDKFMHKISC